MKNGKIRVRIKPLPSWRSHAGARRDRRPRRCEASATGATACDHGARVRAANLVLVTPAIACSVEGEADDVAEQSSAEDFGSVGACVDDVDEGVSGDEETVEGGAEAGEGGPANPAGKRSAESFGSDERDREHGEVGDLVVG